MEIMVILQHFQFKDFYSNIRSPLALVDYLSLIKGNKFTIAFYESYETLQKRINTNKTLQNVKILQLL